MCCSLLGDFCFVFCYLFWRLFKQVWGPDTWRAERGTSSFLCLWSCLRDPTQPYTRTDLWVYQQQIFTQPLWTSSTSPVIPTETLGILIPAGQTSSEPFWKKSGETEGRETLSWRCFFFATGNEETAVQTAEMTGHGAGASYETGSHAGPHMELWLSAGLRSPLCTWIVDLYTMMAPKICGNQPGNLQWERLVRQFSL